MHTFSVRHVLRNCKTNTISAHTFRGLCVFVANLKCGGQVRQTPNVWCGVYNTPFRVLSFMYMHLQMNIFRAMTELQTHTLEHSISVEVVFYSYFCVLLL